MVVEEEVKSMTIYWVSTYSVKSERREEFLAAMKKQREYITEKRKEFKEIKSWRLYTQVYGGSYLSFIDVWEYDSLADCEKCDPEWMTGGRLEEFGRAYTGLIDSGSMSSLIWKPELEMD